jgi:hypothetical protein
MITPFDIGPGWTYGKLLVWLCGLLFSSMIGTMAVLCVVPHINKWSYLGGIVGGLLFWWLTWMIAGVPVFGFNEFLNTRI